MVGSTYYWGSAGHKQHLWPETEPHDTFDGSLCGMAGVENMVGAYRKSKAIKCKLCLALAPNVFVLPGPIEEKA